ncbi:MAG: YceI family protein [Flavobacteriales bacterium]|jgi:polyisoprenoid-binding protein YceI
MKKITFLFALAILFSQAAFAQKYFTKAGNVTFFSHTDIEDIKGDNNVATIVIDAATGNMEVAVLVKSFRFEKALLEEHFNENYMESTKFPKANFKGKIENISAINFKKDGTYTAQITGDLTMHGVTKKITTTGTITVAGGKITADCKFIVNPKDYNIAIPDVVKKQISEKIEVTVKAKLEELVK